MLAQYVDALRLGNLNAFCEIEAESGDWWHPLLDRGAGAALHFAVDHGQARGACGLRMLILMRECQQWSAVLASIDFHCRACVSDEVSGMVMTPAFPAHAAEVPA